MKRLIVMMILLFVFIEPTQASSMHYVYLPLVNVPRVSVIDCVDSIGRLVECP